MDVKSAFLRRRRRNSNGRIIQGDIINIKKIFVICMLLSIFLVLSTASASDVNQTDVQEIQNDDVPAVNIADNDEDVLNANETVNEITQTSYKFTGDSNSMKDSKVYFQLTDKNGNALSAKSVRVSFKNKVSNITTNSKGTISYKLFATGTHNINFFFNQTGYTPVNVTKKLTIVSTSKTTLKASNYVAYQGLKNPFKVTLNAGGVKLTNKKVKFKINGKSYTKTTDSNGVATLNIGLGKGTYTVKYSFASQKNLKSSSGSAKITVKKGMPVTLKKANSLTYRHKVSAPFKIKVVDARGDLVKSKNIVFTINKKTYNVKTDDKGIATINIKLNKGVYTLKVNSYSSSTFKAASKSFTVKVKSNDVKNNGFWLFGSDMKSVDLNKMAKNGVNQIFLNSYAITAHGKTAVSDFAKKAGKLGIKVHIWMQTFNDGSWISPVYSSGKYKYSLFNSIIKEAKEYASIGGVDGIHFDYLRFPGTAHKYKNGVEAINYFTKKACNELHKMNQSIIVSAAVMPEPSGMKYYYGQDIPTISKYLDVIVPMVYKGNYNSGASWIKSTTASFVKMSNGAQIWTGLQGYYSDSNVKKLPASTLINDADYAGFGGAEGVIVFRYSLFNLINFNSL